jgi:ubiquinone/menaquinone biosynthesis C-methylase UbiE
MAEAVGPAGRAYGVDASDGMVQKARETAERLGVTNATFLKADLHSLPLPEESVDMVISNCTINHASDKEAVWREIHRVLKPGGRFVVSDIYSSAEVPEEYARDPEAVAECWAGAVTREDYFRHLSRAGFREVSVLSESEPYAKGKIQAVSFTISGAREKRCCCSTRKQEA